MNIYFDGSELKENQVCLSELPGVSIQLCSLGMSIASFPEKVNSASWTSGNLSARLNSIVLLDFIENDMFK